MKTTLLRRSVQETQCPSPLQPKPSKAKEDCLQRECERLRFLMPKANPLTIELTAQLLMMRGLA